jgi:hypothetical protein
MARVVSVSRRTDVPAFYHEWFNNRLAEGVVGWENPFGGQKYLLSLRHEDVIAFAFWSKNYRPFLPTLRSMKSRGYRSVFNCTITGLPRVFETNVVPFDDAVDSLIEVSRMYSPEHINWRYDPVLTTSATPVEYHIERFTELCRRLHQHVHRCYFSFAIMYGKVERSFKEFQNKQKVRVEDPTPDKRMQIATELAGIAGKFGIKMFTCCGDCLVDTTIAKAHCVDGDVISRLYYNGELRSTARPTRKECGCTESIDIGKYGTCPHGCIYCYANINKTTADRMYHDHDSGSLFLGYSREQSDQFVSEHHLSIDRSCRNTATQLKLEL